MKIAQAQAPPTSNPCGCSQWLTNGLWLLWWNNWDWPLANRWSMVDATIELAGVYLWRFPNNWWPSCPQHTQMVFDLSPHELTTDEISTLFVLCQMLITACTTPLVGWWAFAGCCGRISCQLVLFLILLKNTWLLKLNLHSPTGFEATLSMVTKVGEGLDFVTGVSSGIWTSSTQIICSRKRSVWNFGQK